MALTESLCTQSIQASGPALLAQASGTVQIMAYLISPMVCLIPPHLHLNIIVWMIWPLPTTTGTHTDTPTTGTSGTETDLWVRHVDFLHCFLIFFFSCNYYVFCTYCLFVSGKIYLPFRGNLYNCQSSYSWWFYCRFTFVKVDWTVPLLHSKARLRRRRNPCSHSFIDDMDTQVSGRQG